MAARLKVSREEATQKIEAQIKAGRALIQDEKQLALLWMVGDSDIRRQARDRGSQWEADTHKWVEYTEEVLRYCFTDDSEALAFKQRFDKGLHGPEHSGVTMAVTLLESIRDRLTLMEEEVTPGKDEAEGPKLQVQDWEQVTVELMSNDDFRISGGRQTKTYNYTQADFLDKRTMRPVKAWNVLLAMAEHGEISWDTQVEGVPPTSVKKAIEALRKHLQKRTGLTGDPFKSYRKEKAWRPRFSLQDKRYGGQGAAAARAEGRI